MNDNQESAGIYPRQRLKQLEIDDGSHWPDPQGMEIEWRCIHAPQGMGPGDLLCIASVIAAYNQLLHGEINAQKKLGMIRRAIKAEAKGKNDKPSPSHGERPAHDPR